MRTQKSEDNLAQYFDDRRGDVSLWEEKAVTIRGKASTVFSVRFTGQELTLLQQEAASRRITVSEFIRSAAIKAVNHPAPFSLALAAAQLRQLADDLSSLSASTSEGPVKKLARTKTKVIAAQNSGRASVSRSSARSKVQTTGATKKSATSK